MGSKTTQRDGYKPRDQAGDGRDPDTVLKSLPPGTREWKRVLDAILKKHNSQHAKLCKVVAFKTMRDRETLFFSFFDELRAHTRFKDADPRFLKQRHVQAVVARWLERNLATASIHNYLSFLRTFAGWIGRPGLVREVAFYVGAGSPHAHRKQVAKEDRSWSARSIDIEAKIAEVSAYDGWVGLQLELCHRFGVRPKEARHFRPHGALIPRDEAFERDAAAYPECQEFVRFSQGTKGGRPRDEPLQSDEQRELLARLQSTVAKGWFVGRPDRTAAQNEHRFYNVLRRFGITRKALGVTAHGLRHQSANDGYQADTGTPSPVRGQQERPVNDADARYRTAIRLGHSRLRSSTFYVGTLSKRDEADESATEDEPAEESE
ncbi:MAG: phage integrase N-terminal domain-containing protein [Methylibium sp.]